MIAAELAASGSTVVAFDPADVSTPAGVQRVPHPALAVRRAELVLALTAAADSRLAIIQASDAVSEDAVYADFSTASPEMKAELASVAQAKGFDFVDVALVGMVPGNGVTTRALASGTGAKRFAEAFNAVGGSVEPIDAPAGHAARRKLLRSVAMKGFAAVAQEALAAADAVGDIQWLADNLSSEIETADRAWLQRLVDGTPRHAIRRLAEMESAFELLEDLGQPTTMTSGTVKSLRAIAEEPDMAATVPDPIMSTEHDIADNNSLNNETSADEASP